MTRASLSFESGLLRCRSEVGEARCHCRAIFCPWFRTVSFQDSNWRERFSTDSLHELDPVGDEELEASAVDLETKRRSRVTCGAPVVLLAP